MVNAVWVNADHGRDFHPLADHEISPKEENCVFFSISIFTFHFNSLSDDFTEATHKSCKTR